MTQKSFPVDRRGVPLERFDVPVFDRKFVAPSERPDCEVFMVKSTTQEHLKMRCWCTTEGEADLRTQYDNLPEFEEDPRRGGFVNGQPLMNLSVPVSTCVGARRPRILYRVVHDGQPHYGRKARGYGIVKVTPLMFQMLVTKHLRWQCRQPSPFMSTTNSWEKVGKIIGNLREHGFTGIQVIEFRSSGRGWDHKAQRLFYAPTLGMSLKFPVRPYMENDYLLESHIPPESIRKVHHFQDVYYRRTPRTSQKREVPEGDKKERRSWMKSKNFKCEKRA
ncbi:hypothetical protein F5Y14DRAFT_361637 [Nemania sp. NC0429]|nr:hypothetical protein F5Y14DRAFT_361637 [Nemania sp. NC0429]